MSADTSGAPSIVAAADLNTTADDLRDIRDAAAEIKIEGARYSESSERMVDRLARWRNGS